ncbi:MAG: helix-turn-helix domain-containing protein [Deltaproteobacteria bacterium]|jgi:transcriptional regulator with XRE-family HTH domain|nr:helix-turn-helix domain-containing protein [Deltaproteobacteria bacterium]
MDITAFHEKNVMLQHELDIFFADDLAGAHVVEMATPTAVIKAVREALGLTNTEFALLLGISPNALMRYETLSAPVFPQGNFSRKFHLLRRWTSEAESMATLRRLLQMHKGIATVSGILQAESVSMHMSLTKALAENGTVKLTFSAERSDHDERH